MWTRRPAVAGELAAAHGATAFGELEALIDGVDVVSISVPPTVQPDVAIAAARAGRHVILEKPIADSVDRAEQIARAITTSGVASIVVLTFRFAPETRDWLAGTASGRPWSGGNARWLSGALLGGDFAGSAWRQDNGALLDIGPHLFDLLDASLGTIVDVRSATFTEPDLWHVVCAHEGGAVSTAALSMRLPIDPSVIEFGVYGSAGHLDLSPRQTQAVECFGTLLDELAAMIRAGAATHPCDVRRGVHLQGIIEQVREQAG